MQLEKKITTKKEAIEFLKKERKQKIIIPNNGSA